MCFHFFILIMAVAVEGYVESACACEVESRNDITVKSIRVLDHTFERLAVSRTFGLTITMTHRKL